MDRPTTFVSKKRPPHSGKWRKNRGDRRYGENQLNGHSVRPFTQANSGTNTPTNFHPQKVFAPSQLSTQVKPFKNLNISENRLNNGAINEDQIKHVNINGVPKIVRFYGETTVAFMNWDDPREISFQDGVHRVIFNNICYLIATNNWHQEVNINGFPHRVWLGALGREIYIDEVPYECCFGGPGICIKLNGISTTVKLDGPHPQLKIGDRRRTDLVAGKIDMCIVSKMTVPVFLDAKVQKFFLDGELCSLKFADGLKTVLLNGKPFSAEYGGLPKPIITNGKTYSIRFSALPDHIKPGHVKIKDMEQLYCVRPQVNRNTPILPPLNGIIDLPRRDDSFKTKHITDFANPGSLKVRSQSTITSLYAGRQCSSCGMRFAKKEESRYSQHLDWHFRQNHKRKKILYHAGRRKWYYSLSNWQMFEEFQDLEKSGSSYFEQQKEEITRAEPKVSCVQAHPIEVLESCVICGDQFDYFYNDDEEMWQLRNAIRINDKPYHPACFEDYQHCEIDGESEDDVAKNDETKQETVEHMEDIQDPFVKEEDDDVILNEVTPIVIVIDDDDDDQVSFVQHVQRKPALEGAELKVLPPVKRGTELTGLCSIM